MQSGFAHFLDLDTIEFCTLLRGGGGSQMNIRSLGQGQNKSLYQLEPRGGSGKFWFVEGGGGFEIF